MKQISSRSIKTYLYKIQKIIAYKISSLQVWGKISLFGIFICCVSLFFPWVIFTWNSDIDQISRSVESATSFSALVWNSWFFITLSLGISLFSLFSYTTKKKIHSLTTLSYKVHTILILISCIILYTSIHSLLMIGWLQTFASNIIYGKWIILCITGSFILLIWGLKLRKDIKNNTAGIYINDTKDIHSTPINEKNDEVKDNMKLPF